MHANMCALKGCGGTPQQRMIELRDYQRASVDSMLSYWMNGGGHGLIVLPTGAGKSLCAAQLMRKLYEDHGARVLLATHVSELVAQNSRKLQEIWPEAPMGIYHAGLGKRDGGAPICFAGIHSIYKKPELVGKRDVLLIDEAHLLSHKDDGMYRKLIAHLERETPGMRVAGLTATPYRLSTGRLTDDYGKHEALFSDVVYEEPITRLIERGYLAPVTPYVSPTKLDLSLVRTSAGDYNQKDLQAAVDKEDINQRVVDEICAAGEQRDMWLVFASGVEHSHHLTDLMRNRGIRTECVTGETSEAERKRVFSGARDGVIRCLVGMNVMTTGLDIPNIDLIACVRATKSVGLWTQMIGRGTRTSPGKEDCLLLDFTDNCLEHGPIDQISGSKNAPGAKGAPPQRECPDCHHVHHTSIRNCPKCGHEYPPPEIKYGSQSRAGAILSTQDTPEYYTVDQVSYKRHRKMGSPDSVRIDYICGLISVSQWLAFDSEKGKQLAMRWWTKNSYSGVAPESTDEALSLTDDLKIPGRVLTRKDGKYRRIVSLDYSIPAGCMMPAVERTVR